MGRSSKVPPWFQADAPLLASSCSLALRVSSSSSCLGLLSFRSSFSSSVSSRLKYVVLRPSGSVRYPRRLRSTSPFLPVDFFESLAESLSTSTILFDTKESLVSSAFSLAAFSARSASILFFSTSFSRRCGMALISCSAALLPGSSSRTFSKRLVASSSLSRPTSALPARYHPLDHEASMAMADSASSRASAKRPIIKRTIERFPKRANAFGSCSIALL
mmetsp:Transcript_18371/g.36101  ORF Transcript_18371/g.36101 Transcript_18371/m.36101 type:complete len:219 (-) Transcript_18371:447-1103(-)